MTKISGVALFRFFKAGVVLALVVGGVFVSGATAHAATANITQLLITTSPQTISAGDVSDVITVQTQNAGSGMEKLNTSGTSITLQTTSPTGQFSKNQVTWNPVTTLTMASGTANRSFYYKDSTAGTFTITVSSGSWTAATQTIVVNALPCSTGVGSPLLLDVSQQISNDPDSSVPGPNWALDNFTRHIQVWQEGSSTCTEADDNGTFTTFGGGSGISPQSGTALPQIITGTITGGTHGEITGAPFNASSSWGNNPPAVDCSTASSTCASGLTNYWSQNYFPGGTYNYGNSWGWVYTTPLGEQWVNASDGNTGDVHAIFDSTSGIGYPTIQAAINVASSGDTINVGPGTFDGFSVNGKSNLTIAGVGAGSTVILPTTLINSGITHKYTANMQVSVLVNNSTGITIQGMTIKDNGQTPGSGGPDALVFWNASTGTIQNSNITGTYTINGVQTGQGIAVDASGSQTTNLAINNVNISGFQKNGIDIIGGNGVTSSSTDTIGVSVTGGNITGAGSTSAIAQNGIVVWNRGGGADSVSVNGTVISGFKYAPGGDYGTGILAYGGGIAAVHNSQLTGSDFDVVNAGSPTTDAADNWWGNINPDFSTVTTGTVATIPWCYDSSCATLISSVSSSTTGALGTSTVAISGTADSASKAIIIGTTTISGGNATITIPDGTVITATTTPFDLNSFVAQNGSVYSGLNQVATIEFGIPGNTLFFSQPVTININVGASFDGQTLFVRRSPSFSLSQSDWTDTGLVSPATCTVSGGICSFQTTEASFFSTQTSLIPPAPSSGGGGGGGGGAVVSPAVPAVPAVLGVSTSTIPAVPAQPSVLGAATVNFSKNLWFGMRNDDVKNLQQFLKDKGFFKLTPTGYFGSITLASVKAYQKANGIPATGFVGPLTRAKINADAGSATSLLQQEIQSVVNQLHQLQQSSSTTSTASTTGY